MSKPQDMLLFLPFKSPIYLALELHKRSICHPREKSHLIFIWQFIHYLIDRFEKPKLEQTSPKITMD